MAANNKNRPSWRIPVGHGPATARFPGYQSRFGDGHPNRRQCVAIARRTGERCRQNALRGAACCLSHGGHRWAARAAGVDITQATLRRSRVALAAIGASGAPDGFPVDVALPVSPIDRGRLYEAWRNRALAPSVWAEATANGR